VKFDIVVSDNNAVIGFLTLMGYISDKTLFVTNPRIKDVKDMRVYGSISFWLATHAKNVTEAQFDFTALSSKGKRLYSKREEDRATADDLVACFKTLHTYKVEEIDGPYENAGGGIRLKRN
jgi:hypothetical protein